MKSFARLATLAIAALPLAAPPAIANPAPHFYPSPTAEAWQWAATTEDGSEFYVDTWSVQDGQKGSVFFWYQLNFGQPKSESVGARAFAIANCAAGTMQNRQVTFFDADGQLVGAPSNEPGRVLPENSASIMACSQSRYRN